MDTKMSIAEYNQSQTGAAQIICEKLYGEINKQLSNATSKMYHGSPVWFLNENPVVGYNKSAKGVDILFWSGQTFKEPGLLSKGKYKAAGITYIQPEDVNVAQLVKWLTESKKIQWDYRDIRKNQGRLARLRTT